ncbi:serine/threonine protein kinase S6K family Sck2 [Schizosaccharomyces pombe]|uniref:Serine/threonine-protein kinase sck2 n=1 Tax=Schizosaccharomyces pombe (strain 972 / ATCC 24843) TaxID=284812 RepID=SCK2_SCHPO|nr:serine/threonine protein kinase Sck2 [Schizosaccharomyces pombe]Q10364.1 RecName: Full=Serine/threonine-protein kinase sck2 [Schizosaccharomyces pombe 972h-]CAA93901.1 serine/threonine protein kinase Sck2 [Schizosaccharomyces pombe]|eukprot:NP_594840.1 serine/threonine protein kinase Sck2 [Schizosaccharomyces pombe]
MMNKWAKNWFGLSKKSVSTNSAKGSLPRSPLASIQTNQPVEEGEGGSLPSVSNLGPSSIDHPMEEFASDQSTVGNRNSNDILPEVDHEPSGYLKLQIGSLVLGGPHTDAALAMECSRLNQLFVVVQFGTTEFVSPPLKWESPGRDIGTSSRDSANVSRSSSMMSSHPIPTPAIQRTSSIPNPLTPSYVVFDVAKPVPIDVNIYDHGNNNEFVGRTYIHPSYNYGQFEQFCNSVEVSPAYNRMVDLRLSLNTVFQPLSQHSYGPDDFVPLKLIGKGTFGQVYLVRKKDTERVYAMKVLSKKVIVRRKEVAHTVGERDILVQTSAADSPFIVALRFSFQTPKDLYLVTDYMAGGELFWHLQKSVRFPEERAKFYIAELLLALQALHKRGIVYRDLKPENILLDVQGHIALCDFGLSKANLSVGTTTRTFCGTTDYLAPEVILDEAGYDMMVDFWSLGVLLYEMTCGWSPFYADNTQQLYKNIVFGKVRFPRGLLSVEARDLIKLLLNRNPKHRLGAHGDVEEVMKHPFFDGIDWKKLAAKEISPPFKPIVEGEIDVSNFDVEFTNKAIDRDFSSTDEMSTSAPLSSTVQNGFKGFTYIDASAMDEAFGYHNSNDSASSISSQDDYSKDNSDMDLNRANDEVFMGQIDP